MSDLITESSLSTENAVSINIAFNILIKSLFTS